MQHARAAGCSPSGCPTRFDTRVKVELGQRKGRIVVEFGSVDDLQRIVGVMAPEITGRRASEPARHHWIAHGH